MECGNAWGWGGSQGLEFTWGYKLSQLSHPQWGCTALSMGDIPWCHWGRSCVPWVSPERVPTCPTGDTSPRAQSSWLKLLHINATARLEAPGYQGPFLPPEMLGGDRDKGKDKNKATPLQRGLREALPGALGGQDLIRCDVSTVYGWDIGECHLLPPPGAGTCLGTFQCHPLGCHPPWAPSSATPWGCHPPWAPLALAPPPCYLPLSPPVTLLCHPPQPCHCPLSPSSPPGSVTPLSPPCSPVKFGPCPSVLGTGHRLPQQPPCSACPLSPPVGPGDTDPHGHSFLGWGQDSPWVALSAKSPCPLCPCRC